jgi:hypothetical protein
LRSRASYAKAAAHDLPGDVEHALVAVQHEVDVCGEEGAVQLERDRVRVLRRV